ncbi:MAG: AAA family ATPase [Cyanobacteria bacterium P01_E01_bin.42]
MKLVLTDYQLTRKLYESPNSIIYSAINPKNSIDNQTVILKQLKQTYPPPEIIAGFKREYKTLQKLNSQRLKGVIRVYGLETYDRLTIILEDFGGQSLAQLKLASNLTVNSFFNIAFKITEILGGIHNNYVIHKDINPSNIVLNPTTGEVKIIDFGISTVLSRETTTFCNPNTLEGTLAYISPEQTGRMNRAIDYRTDFYSLGVTFYELLTGQLPFLIDDPLELVHSHIAKQPTPPHQIKPEIPQAVSDIVLKLMAKNAEDRYNSASGIKADLEECQRQWEEKGKIDSFPLGRNDISERFQIPQKLYGREKEINSLLNAFHRVSQGTSEIMLVSGYSGIGKSALVREVYKSITETHGYFITGKFDQFQRNIPYASIIQAFRSLMRQLLTESEEKLVQWKQKLMDALGVNVGVIIKVIPEIEAILGVQPPVAELPPAEAQNRFNLVFQNFITVFTQPEHPLAIFLDDLQWADRASLKLLERLITTPDTQYFFFIGAYRDNEINETHPLSQTIEEIRKTGASASKISLQPLQLKEVTQLIGDTLNLTSKQINPLAKLIRAKTRGNPFFITEFLKSLYGEYLLSFNRERCQWQWDLAQIQDRQITENVVELMAKKVQKLPPETLAVLKFAACVGNQFNLETLAIVFEKAPRETAIVLGAALREGFIVPISDTYKLMEIEVEGLSDRLVAEYKFAHDRIQQAVYSLIPEAERQAVHLHLGQLLLANISHEEREQNIFDIVNQFNKGHTLINERSELDKLATLNLQAGKKAKASVAYQPAFNYLKIGITALEYDSWKNNYDLTLELYVEATEVAYLSGKFEEMGALAETVKKEAKTILDKAKIYEVQIEAYYAQSKLNEAINTSLYMLQLLDIVLPENPSQSDIMQAVQETQSVLGNRDVSNLLEMPMTTDKVKLGAMRILSSLLTASYIVNSNLSTLIILEQINISIKYGNTLNSGFGYSLYGMTLCGHLDDIERGYEYGKLALEFIRRFDAKKIAAKILVIVHDHITIWKEHVKVTLSPLRLGYQMGVETGDFQYGAASAFTYCLHAIIIGTELNWLEQEFEKYANAINKIEQRLILDWHKIYWQSILNLKKQEELTTLEEEGYNEEKIMYAHMEVNDSGSGFHLYFNKLWLNYLFQEEEKAFEYAIQLEEYTNIAAGILLGTFKTYDSLARLAIYPRASEDDRQQILETVAAHQTKMENWAHHAPMNFQHKYYLVEAERARVLDKNGDAREYYDRAIALAKKNEYLNEEALANELAGRYYLSRNQNPLAQLYLKEAHYAYQRWGAVAKVRDIETRYPEFFLSTKSSTLTISNTSSIDTSSGSTELLDIATVIKSTNALSSEIVLEKLLANLMNILIENAGAGRGILILPSDEKLLIEAIKETESDKVLVLQSIPIEAFPKLSLKIVRYVARTCETVVLHNAMNEGDFINDPYIQQHQCQSILCTPLINQSNISGIIYLENNLATNTFTKDRLELLKILSSQAAISIENSRLYTQLEQKVEERTQELSQTVEVLKLTQAELKIENELLRSGEEPSDFDYQVGGSLPMDAPTYVVRSADRQLYKASMKGEFCTILNSRQMGKSSLRVQMVKQLKNAGIHCAAIDLTGISDRQVRPEQWYAGFAYLLVKAFHLSDTVNLRSWWRDRDLLSPSQRLLEFIETILLPNIPGKIAIFIDEIDTVLNLDFDTDPLFKILRYCYNSRAEIPDYNRLTFVLLGAASPYQLIQSKNTTAFNIGQKIELAYFRKHEVQPLLYGLSERVTNPQTLLTEILAWTGGQPFLTQKLCQLIRNHPSTIPTDREGEWLEELVRSRILTDWETQDEPQHLRTIRDYLLQDRQKAVRLLAIYGQILEKNEVLAIDDTEQADLLISGLVINQGGILQVGNRIYESIFGRAWIEKTLHQL